MKIGQAAGYTLDDGGICFIVAVSKDGVKIDHLKLTQVSTSTELALQVVKNLEGGWVGCNLWEWDFSALGGDVTKPQ